MGKMETYDATVLPIRSHAYSLSAKFPDVHVNEQDHLKVLT
jgi:hypothetical protein